MKKICTLIEKYYDILIYLIFGGLTTVVNYVVYIPCCEWLSLSAAVSNMIAWVVAVAFAFVTNKPIVFKSHDWSWGVVWPELVKFVSCRVASGVLETLLLLIFVDILGFHDLWMKLVTSILVIILNYIGSKFLVFRKK